MRNAVVYIGMTYPHGIIRHFALLALELERLRKATAADFDLYFASTDGETGQNAWPMIQETFSPDRILSCGAFDELADRIAELTKKYSSVVVHTGGGWGQTKYLVRAKYGLRRKCASRLHFVATTHAFRIDSPRRIWMSAFQCILYLLFYDKVVFQCSFAEKSFVGAKLLRWLGKSLIIPLGCEAFNGVQTIAPPSLSTIGLDAVLLNSKSFKFVYLAQFRPGKMHVWLVSAMAPVLKERPHAYLILCGMGDTAIIHEVKAIAEHAGVENQVIVPGQIPRDSIPWLLVHSNCAVVPSRGETFGHNFLEPMFAGLPVLGTRVGIGCDVLKDGYTGYGFSLKDMMDFRCKAKRLVDNPEQTAEMGSNARSRVEHTYRHADVAKQLLSLYSMMSANG